MEVFNKRNWLWRIHKAFDRMRSSIQALQNPEGHIWHGTNSEECTGECEDCTKALYQAGLIPENVWNKIAWDSDGPFWIPEAVPSFVHDMENGKADPRTSGISFRMIPKGLQIWRGDHPNDDTGEPHILLSKESAQFLFLYLKIQQAMETEKEIAEN